MRTVVKHEAMALREARIRVLPAEEVDWEEHMQAIQIEDRAVSFDEVTRAAEALQHCKRDEVSALVLRAEGRSYKEICQATGWSSTKLNRCLAEGRSRFAKRYLAIENGEECNRLSPLLSKTLDDEATSKEVGQVRAHLRNCPGCRATLRELHAAQPAMRAVIPVWVILAPVGGGVVERAYESLIAAANDLGVRVQMAADAFTSGKVAAVAASAAAVAGGGVAVDQAVLEPRRVTERERVERAAAPVPTPAATVVATVATPTPEPPAPVATAARGPAGENKAAPRKQRPADEFAFETKAPPPVKAQTTSAKPSGEAAETFGFER